MDKHKDLMKGRTFLVRDVVDIGRAVTVFDDEEFWRNMRDEACTLGCEEEAGAVLQKVMELILDEVLDYVDMGWPNRKTSFEYLTFDLMQESHYRETMHAHHKWETDCWTEGVKKAPQAIKRFDDLQTARHGFTYVVLPGIKLDVLMRATKSELLVDLSMARSDCRYLSKFSIQIKIIDVDQQAMFPGKGVELFVDQEECFLQARGGKAITETVPDKQARVECQTSDCDITFSVRLPVSLIESYTCNADNLFGISFFARRFVSKINEHSDDCVSRVCLVTEPETFSLARRSSPEE